MYVSPSPSLFVCVAARAQNYDKSINHVANTLTKQDLKKKKAKKNNAQTRHLQKHHLTLVGFMAKLYIPRATKRMKTDGHQTNY